MYISVSKMMCMYMDMAMPMPMLFRVHLQPTDCKQEGHFAHRSDAARRFDRNLRNQPEAGSCKAPRFFHPEEEFT